MQPSPVDAVQREFQKGFALHQQGNVAQAKLIYETILKKRPNHFDSLHLLGVITFQERDLKVSESLLVRASTINPRFPAVHSNLGNTLRELGRLDEALKCFEKAIALDPTYAAAYLNRGVIYRVLTRFDLAIECFNKAISLKPNTPEAYYNIGVIYFELKDFKKAVENFKQAISLKPDYANAFYNLGNSQKELKLNDEALQNYAEAIKYNPNFSDAYMNSGVILQDQNKIDASLLYFTKSIALKADNFEAYSNRGNSYKQVGKYADAVDDYNRAIAMNPTYSEAFYNRAIVQLLVGNFTDGWADYEWRLAVEALQASSFVGHAKIDAEFSIHNERTDLIGKSIFIASEQGVGDCIMFMSILPDLCRDAKSIVCQLDQRLIEIFSRHFPEVTFVETGDVSILEKVQIDRYIRMGSLGYTYRRTIEDFPGTAYLTPDALRVAHWKTKLPRDGNKQLIGVSWRGGSAKTNGANRSLTLEQLAPLLDREDCSFVSLQYGEVADEIAAFNEKRTNKLIYFPKSEIDDFEDLTSLIAALDGVVSVQNTVVHTCGALGKPCLAMLPSRPEWRYGTVSSGMAWYSSVELHRQTLEKDWWNVIEGILERASEKYFIKLEAPAS